MARYHQLAGGGTQKFTAEEEKIKKAEEKEWLDGKAERHLLKLRSVRNELLAETDYMALGDITMSNAWKTYRQELRDITKTFKSMKDKDFKFPEKPKG
tara:strand:- start:541 stop:834 length:294 start_codon:yes stop_codon:yes gene_type:complete